MDSPKLAEMLGAEAGGVFQVNDLQWVGWGSDVVLECVYLLESLYIPFQMILRDCRDLHWRVYAHPGGEGGTRPPAMLVNIRLGSDQHRKPLNMLTDFFGLTVYYGQLLIEKAEPTS